jgi:hypothetical protein
MIKYYYNQVQGGYRWNMLQRVFNTIGMEPTGSGDIEINNVIYTYLEFSKSLTLEEEASVAAIMADNPTYPPSTTNSVATILDVWDNREMLKDAFGLDFEIYYTENNPGSGDIDRIKFVFKKQLSQEEKNKVKLEYSNLCTF